MPTMEIEISDDVFSRNKEEETARLLDAVIHFQLKGYKILGDKAEALLSDLLDTN